MQRTLRTAAALLTALALTTGTGAAEEGMWTFDNFPAARMRSEMGWAPDATWLDRAMGASARLPGCSASVVSAQGLVLTNHHCVIACLQALSSGQADYLLTGFMARAREEERRCPGMNVSVLAGVVDVTGRIDAAASGAVSFAQARDAEIARIEEECDTQALRCEVVTLYQGGRYALHRYRRYDDVRLVFAPEQSMAAFGGDAANFNFPRYGADFAFMRVYENGAPAATPHHLGMRLSAVADGDIVIAVGNPGSTSRLRTTAELAFERDVNLPWRISMLDEQRRRLTAFARQGAAQALAAANALQVVENSYKALSGRRDALANPAGFAAAAARESDLQARVRRNLAAQRETGDAWGEIERAETAYRSFFLDHQLLEARAGERSELFALARDIVRGTAEREKPENQRMPRYAAARLPAIASGLRAERIIHPELEQLTLEVWLDGVLRRFPASSPVAARIFGGETPASLASRLSLSRVADQAYRMQLWNGGAAAVAASDDLLIAFVRAWDEDARVVRARYLTEVEAPIVRAQERIARARFRAFGMSEYPEATFSPRLSYGRVAGWAEHGEVIAPLTRLGGLYAHGTDDDPALRISQRWLDARARLDPGTVFNIASSNDVIAGNSGGALLDRDGRVAGVVFDGNIHSLGGEYYYDGAVNRAIAVASPLIMTTLRDVYGMQTLAAELEPPAQ